MKILLVIASMLLSSVAHAGNDPKLDEIVSRYVAHNLKKAGNEINSSIERHSLSMNTTPEAILSYCVNEAPDANNPKNTWCGFAVFVSRDGHWIEVGHKTGDAKIDGKFIDTIEEEYTEKDPLCCPSITVNTKYRLTEKGLRRIKRQRTRND